MKPLRALLAVLAAVVAALAAAAALALAPPFQSWAAHRYLAARPGWGLAVGRVSVGPAAAYAAGLRLERSGAVLTAPAVRVDLPVADALWKRELPIRRLAASGWTLDLTHFEEAGTAPPALLPPRSRGPVPAAAAAHVSVPATIALFDGFFHKLRLPADCELDALELEGDVILPPAAGAPPARVHLELSGGGLAAGREGRFVYRLSLAPPAAGAPIGSLSAEGVLAAAMDTPRTFSRLEAGIDASAQGGKLAAPAKLTARVAAARTGADESFSVALAGTEKQLLALQAGYAGSTHLLAGSWKLDLSDGDLAPFALGAPLPSFAASGEGRFDADATLSAVRVDGRLGLTADRLGVLRPALAAVGPVGLTADFDLSHRDGEVSVARLAASVAGGQPVARIDALQPFALNVHSGELKVADPARDLVGIELQGLPAAWTGPLWPGLTPTAGALRGRLVASARNGGLSLRSDGPLTLDGLYASRAGHPVAAGLDLTASLTADYAPAGWQVSLSRGAASRGSAPLLSFQGRAGRLAGAAQPVAAAGEFHLHLPDLAAATGGAAPARGDLSGDFTARIGGVSAVQARLEISDLAADAAAEPWSLIAVELRADQQADGRWKIAAPLAFARAGRKSDLTLQGTLAASAGGTVLEGQLAGAKVVLGDVSALGALEALRGATAAGTDAPAAAGPFWGLLRGRLTLALKEVDGGRAVWNDVGGTVRLEPAALSLSALQGRLATGGDFSGGLSLAYDPAAPRAYALQAELAASDFDYGAFSRARDPSRVPVIEGRFKISGRLHAAAAQPLGLLDALQGDLQLSSKGGIFRALRADVADALRQSPALLSEAIGSVTSLFGLRDDKGAEAKGVIDKQGQAVVALAERLRELPYDQINVAARRGPDLNIEITSFSLIAPEVRLSGAGRITHEEGVGILDQPFAFDGQLGARGRLGELMGGLGLLGSDKDDLGYTRMGEAFHLGGSLGAIDASSWRDQLLKSALHKAAGGVLDKLLGK
ncbi:MAG TPA: hypothetical protein VHC86_12455 [Opitutaceae bacterium]|nr:hypothetical protein [Opitutaceae bacterium]